MDEFFGADEGFRRILDHRQASLNTCVVGTVEKYDPDKKRADVKPVFIDHFETDAGTVQAIDYPVIQDIPVLFPRGGGFSITWPLKKGDPVVLIFAQRSLDEWKAGDGKKPTAQESLRMHDLSDALCIAGAFPDNDSAGKADDTSLHISHKEGKVDVEIKPDGKINATCARLNVGSDSAAIAMSKATTADQNFLALQIKLDIVCGIFGIPPIGTLPSVASDKGFLSS